MTEETIFAAAIEKRSPRERQTYLDQVCAGNPGLRAAVEELLKADSDAGSFLNRPPVGMDATIASDSNSRDTAGSGTWAAHLSFLQPCNKPDRLGQLDDYEIIEVVGHGGMGAVLRAFDTKLSRVVAVKVMSPTLAANPMAVKRFLREAKTAAAVHHDHVVTIHAVDDAHQPPYIVMQFVEGQTLQQKIDREGALELKHILRIGSQAASGLAAAHKLGLIHRDVKPANILLENGVERVKISDFGLARAADDVQMTQTGIIAGTPQYMSPEQARGEPVDTRSDLFSLGSVLYTMCTGRPAFRADHPVAVLRRVCDDAPRPIREVNPEIPDWLEAIVHKLLSKGPADRFQSAAEVADLLSQHLAHVQNPAIAPRPLTVVAPPQIPLAAGLWRDGNLLVMHRNSPLPDVCLKSNAKATHRLKRRVAWHHPAIYLAFFLNPVLYLILALVLQKSATIYIPLSHEWFLRRRQRMTFAWGAILGGLALTFTLATSAANGRLAQALQGTAEPLLMVFAGCLLLFGIVYGLLACRLVSARRMTDDHIWLRGVNREFLNRLEVWRISPSGSSPYSGPAIDAAAKKWEAPKIAGRGLFIEHPVIGVLAIAMLLLSVSVATYLLTLAIARNHRSQFVENNRPATVPPGTLVLPASPDPTSAADSRPQSIYEMGIPGATTIGPSQALPVDATTWGKFIHAEGDGCSILRHSDALSNRITITVPGTRPFNLMPGFNLDAPRLMAEDVAGDFLIEVKLPPWQRPLASTSSRGPEGNSYLGAGLVVWIDEQNLLRWERAAWGEQNDGAPFLHAEWCAAGQRTDRSDAPTGQDTDTYLQIQRRGNQLNLLSGSTGTSWFSRHLVTDIKLPPKISVGIYAQNSTTTEFNAAFERLAFHVQPTGGTAGSSSSASPAPPIALAPFDAQQAKLHQEAWAAHLGTPVEITNSIGMKLRLSPPGEFLMGTASGAEQLRPEKGWYFASAAETRVKAEHPQHSVRISRPSYLGQCEVTLAQFREFVSATGYETQTERDPTAGIGWRNGKWTRSAEFTWKNPGFPVSDDHPVCNVTWNDAQLFCKWLSEKEGLEYRLPTEAQWEFACRAGTTTNFSSGADPSSLQGVANIADATLRAAEPATTWAQPWSDGFAFTAPVGSFKPNAFGLFDVHGNAWEWCEDFYDANDYANSTNSDPSGPVTGNDRVFRGGGWDNWPGFCRSADRYSSHSPTLRTDWAGFRVAIVGDLTKLAAPKSTAGSSGATAGSPSSAPPAQPQVASSIPPDSAAVQALRDLVAAKERLVKFAEDRDAAGVALPTEKIAAVIDHTEAQIRLVEAQRQPAVTRMLLQALITQRDAEREIIEPMVKKGLVPEAQLEEADAKLADAKFRLAQAEAAVAAKAESTNAPPRPPLKPAQK